jgi:regulatory protein YycI of two-component signal transduction system YycFG
MDWSRAKTVLIWAFLLLDVFLGYQVYASRMEHWQNTEAVQGDKWDIELYLKQQNIKLQADVPQETPEMKYLNVEYLGLNALAVQNVPGIKVTVENTALVARLEPPMPVREQTNPVEILRQLKPRLLYSEQYVPDLYFSSRNHVRYLQLHDKLPLFVAPLEVTIENGVVRQYRQTYFHIRGQGSGRQVISAYSALRSLVEKQILHPGEKIENVALGYYGYHYDADIQVLAPVWRVIHEGKQHFVNAFTGAVERPMVPEK